jgi:hypothetical protein
MLLALPARQGHLSALLHLGQHAFLFRRRVAAFLVKNGKPLNRLCMPENTNTAVAVGHAQDSVS